MAKKFQFDFEPVLQLRKRKEQLSRQRFVRAQAAQEATAATLERLAESLREASREAAAALAASGGCNEAHDRSDAAIADYPRQIGELLQAQALHRSQFNRRRQETQSHREEFLADMKNRKAFSRLKERQAARHEAICGRAALRELDDLYATHAAAFQPQARPDSSGQAGEVRP